MASKTPDKIIHPTFAETVILGDSEVTSKHNDVQNYSFFSIDLSGIFIYVFILSSTFEIQTEAKLSDVLTETFEEALPFSQILSHLVHL